MKAKQKLAKQSKVGWAILIPNGKFYWGPLGPSVYEKQSLADCDCLGKEKPVKVIATVRQVR